MPEAAFTFLAFFFKHALDMGESLSDVKKKFIKTVSENCSEELQALERAINRLQDREDREDLPEIDIAIRTTNISMALLLLRG
ncbi:MAG: hypothetical protein Q4D85_11255 [Corynebacterium sp.]|uniref:hypothetical protein n=1 Tax=Corynebacterium sp. TaxID=1720 RepID=UPI0026DB7BB5|nr:hypothetical protein [Corynebacterium sp.]MDO5099312.1 hypothetical protein [Corynebacterium sp.]